MVQHDGHSTQFLWDRYQAGVHAEGVCALLDPMECSAKIMKDPPQLVRDAMKVCALVSTGSQA